MLKQHKQYNEVDKMYNENNKYDSDYKVEGREGKFMSSPTDPGMGHPRMNTVIGSHLRPEILTPYANSRYRPVYFEGAYKGHLVDSSRRRGSRKSLFERTFQRIVQAPRTLFKNRGSSSYGRCNKLYPIAPL